MVERVTLRQVAEVAGVSLGTASQALSNKSTVSPETRARVFEAAEATGYKLAIRTSVSTAKRLNTIGMLIKHDNGMPPALNPFYSYVLSGVDHECQRQKANLMYATVEVDQLNRPLELPPMLLDLHVDGLIVVGAFLEETIANISRQATPNVVLVDAYAPSQQFDNVVIDNINGAQAAVEHLIGMGHRHIGLVGSVPDAFPSIRERRKGYSRALRDHGLTDYIEDSELSREGGYEATRRLLKRASQVTAIFACNDTVAFGVMSAAYEMGRQVPDDLSVIGFDDIDAAQEVIPPLTTVHVDKVLMGVLAVRYLYDRIQHSGRTTLTTSVGTQLVLRDSVQALQ